MATATESKTARGTGKREKIEPYKWDVPPAPGMRSLFSAIADAFGRLDRTGLVFTFDCPDQTMAFYGLDRAHCEELIRRYNAGERWFVRD